MKKIISVFLITFALLSCKAQSVIKPLDGVPCPSNDSNCYDKDVNNEFDKFVGTWKYTNGTNEIIFKLKKEEHYQTSPNSNYQDLLVGEYQYKSNGITVVNTLDSFDNPFISGFSHNISGGSFKHRLPNHCIDNSDVSEIKIWLFINHPTENDTEGRVILRYLSDNGVEKLQACIYDDSALSNDVDARIDISDGYYEFIKQ